MLANKTRLPKMMASAVLVVMVLALTGLNGCEEEKLVFQDPELGTITINLDNFVGVAPVALNQMNYTNSSGTNYSIKTLKYVISDVRVHTAGGRTAGMDDIHYRDEADPATRGFTLNNIPKGTYNSISFTFGLDDQKNLRDAYANMPEFDDFHSDLQWPLPMGPEMGYHYLKLEGDYVNPGQGYATHTGARKFQGNMGITDEFAHHHFFVVTIPLNATFIDGDNARITITMDINGWYEDPIDFDIPTGPIMGDLDSQGKLQANGPSCFTATISKP